MFEFGNWRARSVRNLHREEDIAYRWPVLLEKYDVEEARNRFLAHAVSCPSWTEDYAYDEIARIVLKLPTEMEAKQ